MKNRLLAAAALAGCALLMTGCGQKKPPGNFLYQDGESGDSAVFY